MSEQTAIAKTQTFEERLTDKIKESIGDLIPPEELKRILETGLNKIFFQSRVIPSSNSWGSPQSAPALAEELAAKFLKEAATELMTQFLKDNTDKIIEQLRPAFERQIGDHVLDAFNRRAQSDLIMLGENIINRIRNGQY